MAQQSGHRTNRWRFILNLGFYAGLIWGAFKIGLYYVGFTKVIPAFLVEPFMKHDLLASWTGHIIGLLSFIIFSLIASFVYYGLFKKVRGPWMGMIYGLLWWALLYIAIGPPSGMMKNLLKLDMNSITSDLCMFLLWGVFIGYTIAVEFNDESQREPFNNFDTPE